MTRENLPNEPTYAVCYWFVAPPAPEPYEHSFDVVVIRNPEDVDVAFNNNYPVNESYLLFWS